MIKFISFITAIIICINTNASLAKSGEDTDLNQNTLPVIQSANVDTNIEKELPVAPKCESDEFYEKVVARIQEFSSTLSTTSTLGKRKKALILANIDGFETINVNDITPKTDRNTANALITIKVNKHYKNSDFIVCKQRGANKPALYLIIYPQTEDYMVHIINLDPYSDSYDTISFTYPE